MSFAIYAAPFENNNNNNTNYNLIDNETDIINKKKTAKNKTQKKRNLDENIDNDVLNTIKEIHNTLITENDEENNLSNFTPPPPALSAGSERIDMREELEDNNSGEEQYSVPYAKQYNNQYIPKGLVSNEVFDDSAYKNVISNPSAQQFSNNTNTDIVERMNYMIHLLEDQQSKKTEHVTEEIILYSFLGIFTIFVVDSFARVGKYVR